MRINHLLIIFLTICLLCCPVFAEDFLMGSYHYTVKDSNIVSGGDDIDLTISSLKYSNNNLYGYPADDGDTGDSDSGFHWKNFLELLEKTKDTDLKIFAVVRESHLIYGSDVNRWGVGRESTKDEWVNSHVKAATEFSELASIYPNLVGWSIDDFSLKICSPIHEIKNHDCYTKEQVEEITIASKSSSSNFEFWPTLYFRELYSFTPGYAMGSTYGVKMFPDEYASVDFKFNLDSDFDGTMLSFFHYDDEKSVEDDKLEYSDKFKQIFKINDHVIWDRTIAGDKYVEFFEEDISTYLKEGDNSISIKFYTDRDSASNGYYDKMTYISNPVLSIGEKEIEYTVSYDSFASGTYYDDFEGVKTSNDGSIDGIVKIVSIDTSNSNVANFIDGALMPYYRGSKYYDNFNDIITKTEELLPVNFKNLLVLYENFWDTKEDNNYLKIDPIQLRGQIMFSSGVTDGVIVWYHPLVFAFNDEGIFSRRNLEGEKQIFYFPGHNPGLPGYFQQWETVKSYSEYNVLISDSDNSEGRDYFFKEIFNQDGKLEYRDSVQGDEGEEKLTFHYDKPQKLKLKISENLGVGNYPLDIRFKVEGDDSLLGEDDFIFSSGSEDPNIISLFSTVVSAFNELSSKSIDDEYNPIDLDGDGKVDYKDAITFTSLYKSGIYDKNIDLNSDGVINWGDIKLFLASYLNK